MVPEAKTTQLKAIKSEKLPANIPENFGSECGGSEDVVIPYLMLAQGNLDFIREGKAAQGDIVDSDTKTPVAKFGQEIEVIPFYLVKYWRVDKTVNGKTMKDRVFPFHAIEHAEWKGTKESIKENGEDKTRYLCYMMYCLNAKNLSALPYTVVFKKGSMFTGKFVSGYFNKCGRAQKTPASNVLKLSAKSATNPLNNAVFFKFDTVEGRVTSLEEKIAAYEWYQIVAKSAAKAIVDHEEEGE